MGQVKVTMILEIADMPSFMEDLQVYGHKVQTQGVTTSLLENAMYLILKNQMDERPCNRYISLSEVIGCDLTLQI